MNKTNNKTINEEFLESYKKLEQLMQEIENCSIYEYENKGKISDADANKLSFCRYARNFCVHNADSKTFITVTQPMVNFINKLTNDIQKSVLKAKDVCIIPSKSKYISKDTTMDIIAPTLTKQDFVLIMDENKKILGQITKNMILKMMVVDKISLAGMKKIKCSDVCEAVKNLSFVNKDAKADEINVSSIVTDTGSPDGTVIGLIII